MTRYVIAFCLMAVLLSVGACGTSVHPGQRGLRWYPLTEGLSTEPLKSGFYWRAPWNDVFVYDVRWQSYTEKVDALSADDLPITLHSAVTMRPIDKEIYFLAQEVGPRWYQEVVRPLHLSAVRSVVSNYPMVTIPEQSIEIGNKIEAVMVEALKGRHLEIATVALSEIELSKQVLEAVERKQAKEQEKEQKEFEVLIANRDAEIARIHAKGEGDAIKIRAEGEAEGQRIRAMGQAKAQETITKTLTPDYLRFKLYESPNAKLVLLPERTDVPLVLNPGMPEQSRGFQELEPRGEQVQSRP
jgi:regulator of protease activity HflC (stomatin/prohibitin superfamily)